MSDPIPPADSRDYQATIAPTPTPDSYAATLSSSGSPGPLSGLAPPPDIPGYQILDELGRGGMGVVYRAVQTRLNRAVALKMILAGEYASAAARVRFMTEAEVVARLQHPNIVQLYEFNVHNGIPYFSLEFVEGGTLERRLARQPLPPAEAAALVETLARAVQAAHDAGVVHRDLKPSNILLQPRPGGSTSGRSHGGSSSHRSLHGDGSFGMLSCVIRDAAVIPKITDFGLAKAGEGGTGVTVSGAVMGTPSYMAPEQARGQSREVGTAADVYSLGAILYECLTGRPPFHAPTPVETVMQVLETDPVAPRRLQPKVPRDLETICLKCLQKAPAKRYASAQALAEDLARYLHGEAITARPTGPGERAVRWARRHPSAAALCIVSTLLVLSVAALGWVTSARLGAALEEAERQRHRADQLRGQAEAAAEDATRQQRSAETAAAEAERQRQTAEAHAVEAERQRQTVAANLQNRLDMVDDILFNMDARLENVSGAESIRREFLDEVRKFSDQLLKDNPDDPAVLRQASRVYRSVGEVTRRDRSGSLSDTTYRKAIDLARRLVERFPDKPEYLVDLTRTLAGRAMALWYAGRLKEADTAFAETITHYDRRAERTRDLPARIGAARMRYYRANVVQELGRRSEAIALFREALARQDQLVAASPKNADILEDLGLTATGLAVAVEPSSSDETLTLLRQALTAHRKAAQLNPRSSRLQSNLSDAYDDLSAFCQRRHRDADLALLAEEYLADPPDARYARYNSACYLALAARAAAPDPLVPAAVWAVRAETHARRAVARLSEAADRGITFDDRVHLLKDADLDGLRGRDDYKALLAKLEKRFPGRPVTPADLLASFREEYDNALLSYTRLTRLAQTPARRQRAERARPNFGRFADRVLRLADESAGSSAALDALLWVIEKGSDEAKTDPLAGRTVDRALAALGRYLDRSEFANACPILGKTPSDSGDKLLQVAATSHRDTYVRGLAAYALGQSLALQAEEAQPGSDLQAKLSRQAEDQLEKVVKEFETVVYKDSTLGALARRKLIEVRSLSLGRLARPIEGVDLNGQPLKLSDSRGKVTLVFFWANWCGFCRQLYTPSRRWVEEYRGRPFAMVGVNCDDEKEAGKRAVEREKLPWPSWWDGGSAAGRLTEEWLVDAFPTLYLIDHDGVIQKKWQGMPPPDEVRDAIDTLVRRAERAKK